MIKVAMVTQSGEVAYIISPAINDMYTDGQVYNDHTARHISHECVDSEVLETWYWNDGWQTREAQPSVFHDWIDRAWLLNKDRLMLEIRNQRQLKLAQCDWTQMYDSPLTETEKANWRTYRQALRDLPQNYPDATTIDEVNFPSPPA